MRLLESNVCLCQVSFIQAVSFLTSFGIFMYGKNGIGQPAFGQHLQSSSMLMICCRTSGRTTLGCLLVTRYSLCYAAEMKEEQNTLS